VSVKSILKALLLLVAVIAIGGGIVFSWISSRGISARAQPGRVETVVARTMRGLAIPRAAREMKNPVAKSADVVAEGMAHYADHCAVCHANDGSGDTEMGRGLYPKPPDLRLSASQSLTDGELFYIIENGVRLTGMPAWATGSQAGEHSSWHLVHFIRELPRLTPEDLEKMKALNPRSPDEIRQEMEEEKFLAGEPEKPPARPSSHTHKD
jgi:mono/diheme cytochrome c family protein